MMTSGLLVIEQEKFEATFLYGFLPGGLDDDLGAQGRNTDLDARVTILSQLALEELVQLGVEDTVSDELKGGGKCFFPKIFVSLFACEE